MSETVTLSMSTEVIVSLMTKILTLAAVKDKEETRKKHLKAKVFLQDLVKMMLKVHLLLRLLRIKREARLKFVTLP